MSLRFDAIRDLKNNQTTVAASAKITGIFNSSVFTLKTAREYLTDESYKSLMTSIRGGKKLTVPWPIKLPSVLKHGPKVKA